LIILARWCYSFRPLEGRRYRLLDFPYYRWRQPSITVRSAARKKYSQSTCIRIRALIGR
jgi:hypothetical protein